MVAITTQAAVRDVAARAVGLAVGAEIWESDCLKPE